MKKLSLLVLALALTSSVMVGQLKKGGMAITTEIAPAGAIGGAYALSESMRLNAGLNFGSISPGGGANSTTAFGVGASLWMYSPAMENVTMFYGAGVSFGSQSSGGVSASTFGFEGDLGAEYWFSPRFAWGGYVAFGFASTSSGGVTSSNFGTQGVGTSLTWWFN
jgi:hypothetical protein